MNYYLFRIDANSLFIKSEIKANRLRQGWGTKGLNLLDTFGNIVRYEEWKKNYNWNEEEKRKKSKYNNFLKMLEMKEEDLIVVPKFPEWNQFTIFKVTEKYRFKLKNGYSDHGHIIGINYETSKTFNYHVNEKTQVIHSKTRSYQSPINSIRNIEVQNALDTLFNEFESDIEPKDIAEIIKNSFFSNFMVLNEKLSKALPSSTEKLVENIFCNAGYTLENKNQYDREGGDADLVFSKKLNIISEFSQNENFYQLFIQVKQRLGTDYNEFEGMDQLDKITEELDLNNQLYSKILISTSVFSDEAKSEAQKRNIILIDGESLTKLILKYL